LLTEQIVMGEIKAKLTMQNFIWNAKFDKELFSVEAPEDWAGQFVAMWGVWVV